jgi:hypothetical protein
MPARGYHLHHLPSVSTTRCCASYGIQNRGRKHGDDSLRLLHGHGLSFRGLEQSGVAVTFGGCFGFGVALMTRVGVADTLGSSVYVAGTNWVGNSLSVGVAPVLATVVGTGKAGAICDGVGVTRSRGAIPSATNPMI